MSYKSVLVARIHGSLQLDVCGTLLLLAEFLGWLSTLPFSLQKRVV